MSMQVGEFLFGGKLGTYPVKNLIHGWQSDLVETVCPYDTMSSEEYFMGDAIYYDPFVTPILNNIEGTMSKQTITVSTGTAEGSYPNQITGMNGYSYPNKEMGVYTMGSDTDGAATVQAVNYRCPGKSGDFDNSKRTFNGVQNEADSTGETSYVLDTKGLHWIDLDFTANATLCADGTGSDCSQNFNNYTQLIKENESSEWASEDSCGYNIHLGG